MRERAVAIPFAVTKVPLLWSAWLQFLSEQKYLAEFSALWGSCSRGSPTEPLSQTSTVPLPACCIVVIEPVFMLMWNSWERNNQTIHRDWGWQIFVLWNVVHSNEFVWFISLGLQGYSVLQFCSYGASSIL